MVFWEQKDQLAEQQWKQIARPFETNDNFLAGIVRRVDPIALVQEVLCKEKFLVRKIVQCHQNRIIEFNNLHSRVKKKIKNL